MYIGWFIFYYIHVRRKILTPYFACFFVALLLASSTMFSFSAFCRTGNLPTEGSGAGSSSWYMSDLWLCSCWDSKSSTASIKSWSSVSMVGATVKNKNAKLELPLFLHRWDSPKYLNVLICLSSKTFSFYIFQLFLKIKNDLQNLRIGIKVLYLKTYQCQLGIWQSQIYVWRRQ